MSNVKDALKIYNAKNTTLGVYVGRKPAGMHFGNPFTHKAYGTQAIVVVDSRDDAVKYYRYWLDGTIGNFPHNDVEPERRRWILDNLYTLKGKDLRCWCAPLACHAKILIELANKE